MQLEGTTIINFFHLLTPIAWGGGGVGGQISASFTCDSVAITTYSLKIVNFSKMYISMEEFNPFEK